MSTIYYPNKKSKSDILNLSLSSAKNTDNLSYIIKHDRVSLIEGDNFTAMSLLIKDYKNKIDLIYIDPPYNTGQDFYCSKERTVSVGKATGDIVAYSDKMLHDDYLEYIRERLYLMRELLSDRGTIYLHIDVKMGHYIKIILDEVFGVENFVNEITRIKCSPKNFNRKAYGNIKDTIYVYVKNRKKNIFNNLKNTLDLNALTKRYNKIDKDGRRYTTAPCHAPGETANGETGKEWNGKLPPRGRHWRYPPKELDKLDRDGKIEWSKNGVPRIISYIDEHEGDKIQDVWLGFKDKPNTNYPTQKNSDMLELIVKQSSHENSIVLDCFCGSGSFLEASIKNNRIAIGIDKSPVAISIAKEKIDKLLKIE